MCSGRVDLSFVLRSFLKGADGVCIIGCHLGECNYVTQGNYHALNMVQLCRKLLDHIGINSERLVIEWCSSSEGVRFAEVVRNFTDRVTKLGPLGTEDGVGPEELKVRLEELLKLVPYIKLAKKEKLSLRLKEEEYEGLYTKEEVEQLLREVPSYYIDPGKCQACGICRRRCPAGAILGDKNLIHIIDQEKCIRCGTCLEVCPPRFGAVRKLIGEPVPPPVPEEERTIVREK